MKSHATLNEKSLVNTLAAIIGVAAAMAVKLLLAPSRAEPSALVIAERHRLMREAATDPLYLADLREVNDDFAFTDADVGYEFALNVAKEKGMKIPAMKG